MQALAATERLTAHSSSTWWVVFISKNVLVVTLTADAKMSSARLARNPPRKKYAHKPMTRKTSPTRYGTMNRLMKLPSGIWMEFTKTS